MVRSAHWPSHPDQPLSSLYWPTPNLSGLAAAGALWLPASQRPQGPSGWLWEEGRQDLGKGHNRLQRPLTPPPVRPEAALTLDNSQHSVGPVQGDSQAQCPEVPLLLKQVVQFLLPGGGRWEDRAIGLWLKAEPSEHSLMVSCVTTPSLFPHAIKQGCCQYTLP